MQGSHLLRAVSHARLLLYAVALLAGRGHAQTSSTYSSIVGTVTDSSAAVIADAVVKATNMETNITSSTKTNGQGIYRIDRLIAGSYRLTVEHTGFKVFSREGIRLSEAQSVRVDASLQLGESTERMDVRDDAPLVQTESPQISGTLPFSVRKYLPTVAPSFFNTLTLQAGAVSSTPNYYVSFNGSTATQYDYAVDGQTFRDPFAGHNAFIGHFNEWQQDQTINSASNSAQYSQLVVVNAATKSGTNELHGSAAYYYTSGGLQGRNPFSPVSPHGVNPQYAGSIGGPIKKNRAFFFVAYGDNQNGTAKASNGTVPTDAMRHGDFSGFAPIIDPTNGTPFPNNVIPADRISSVSANFIQKFYPEPNYGGAAFTHLNFRTQVAQHPVEDDVVSRVDYRINDRHSLFVRYSFDEGNRGGLFTGSLPTVGFREGYRRDQNATLSGVSTFGPTLFNEFSVGFSRDFNLINPSSNYEPAQSGLVVATSPVPALPVMNISGLTTVSQQDFYNGIGQTMTTRDNVSWMQGRHHMIFGAMWMRGNSTSNSFSGSNLEGQYSFDNTFATGNAFANFLLGLPTSIYRLNPLNLYKYNYLYRDTVQVFAQDDIQVSRQLTVNVGLRYEYYSPWNEKTGRMNNLDLTTGDLVVPNSSVSLLDPSVILSYGNNIKTASQLGYPASMIRFSETNFAPRVGFAYRPMENTVVRMGYGIFYDFNPPATQTTSNLYLSPEYFPTNTITNGVPLYQFPNPFGTVNAYQGVGVITPAAAARDERMPYSQQWSVSIEHQFHNTGARLSYIGTRGVDQLISYDANVPRPTTVQLQQSDRPFPQYGPISWVQNGSGHHYDALQLNVTTRTPGGAYLNSNFTWAKDLGLNQGNGLDQSIGVQNPFDANADYGNTATIPRYRWVTTGNWDLPIGRGQRFFTSMPAVANALFGGWKMTGVFTAQSGDWLTPTYCGYDPTGSPGQDFYCGRPDRIANGNLPSGQRTQQMWFNAGAFTFPGASVSDPLTPPTTPIGRFGNSGVGIIQGPGFWQADVGLVKSFAFRERWHLSLFTFATNLLNHPALGDPNMDISDPSSVGQIDGIRSKQSAEANDPGVGMRVLTLGLRLEF